MQISSNTTPYLAELFVQVDKDGFKYCVAVVKGTFGVDETGRCAIADEQAGFVFVDEHHGDPGTTSIKYESDFAPLKPNVDLLIRGSAHAPNGKPVSVLTVALAAPGVSKTALITGDREWERRGDTIVASDPQLFHTMPLIWERSFGGADTSDADATKHGWECRNLVGTGFHVNRESDSVVGKRLPNIERVDQRIRSWVDKPDPIGFGPLGRGWQPRIRWAGTYNAHWMDERLPFLPDDFDNRYFQAAPPDQQLPVFAEGALITCTNMCQKGVFAVRVPEWRVPVRFVWDDKIATAEVTPDTLILEPDLRRFVVVGRTRARLPRKALSLREVQIGNPQPSPSITTKPHYAGLGQAVDALRRR